MPIIIQNDPSFSDVASLAMQTGAAQGEAQQFNAQRSADQSFINQAIHASQVRNSGPGYFTTQSEGEAMEANANQRYADTQAGLGAQLGIQQENANTAQYQAQTQRQAFQSDQASAQANAQVQSAREDARRQNAQAAYNAGGPAALAAYAGIESFAETGQPPPAALLNAGQQQPAAKAAPAAKAPSASQYQKDAQTQIDQGNAAGVLPEMGQTSLPPLGTPPGGQGPLTQHAMEVAAALHSSIYGDGSMRPDGTLNTGMDLNAVKNLRDQVATGTLSPAAKTAAMQVIDQGLQVKQAMRDSEIQTTYERINRQILQSDVPIARGPDTTPEMRLDAMKQVGTMVAQQLKADKIPINEYNDWLARQQLRQSNPSQAPAPMPKPVTPTNMPGQPRPPLPLPTPQPVPGPAAQQPRGAAPRGPRQQPQRPLPGAKKRADAGEGGEPDTATAQAPDEEAQ